MDPGPAARLSRVLDSPRSISNGDRLPEAWQWLHFLPDVTQSALGPDGHEERGAFLPPIAAPRRMFAAGKATFHRSLVLGRAANLMEKIESVDEKQGRTGPLVIVRVGRRMVQDGTLAIEEQQSIVYRSAPQASEPVPERELPPIAPQWRQQMRVDPVLLFRFSAVTFNAHRIHYDRDYSRLQEGYPGLVIHGPLIALLLLEEARHRIDLPGVAEFSFRAVRPLFDVEPFWLCGRVEGSSVAMWAEAIDGSLALRADARCTEPTR
jgi:3-methylfumaryl-CoA hydratase